MNRQGRFPHRSQSGGGGVKSRSSGTPAGGGAETFSSRTTVYYSPDQSQRDLLDSLAEKQAEVLEVNSAQLRRFFGHIKELYRRYQSQAATCPDAAGRKEIFERSIEPLFRMVRSKVAYARRQKKQSVLSNSFADFLETSIQRVPLGDPAAFETYVLHLEAVVGFMYGNKKVIDK